MVVYYVLEKVLMNRTVVAQAMENHFGTGLWRRGWAQRVSAVEVLAPPAIRRIANAIVVGAPVRYRKSCAFCWFLACAKKLVEL